MAGRPWILCRDTGHGRELLADPGPWCELCLTPAPAGRALHLCQLLSSLPELVSSGKGTECLCGSMGCFAHSATKNCARAWLGRAEREKLPLCQCIHPCTTSGAVPPDAASPGSELWPLQLLLRDFAHISGLSCLSNGVSVDKLFL